MVGCAPKLGILSPSTLRTSPAASGWARVTGAVAVPATAGGAGSPPGSDEPGSAAGVTRNPVLSVSWPSLTVTSTPNGPLKPGRGVSVSSSPATAADTSAGA